MSNWNVYKPLNEPLMVRSSLQQSVLTTKPKKRQGIKLTPRTCFGPLNSAKLFTRHNPHPVYVRHLNGLLDMPICHVFDDENKSMQETLARPPSQQSILRAYLPSSTINVNNPRAPIDTITGLQYFTGLHNFSVRKKEETSRLTRSTLSENWRLELKALAEAALNPVNVKTKPQSLMQIDKKSVPRELGSSRQQSRPISRMDTSQICRPESRASRCQSPNRKVTPIAMTPNYRHISSSIDVEGAIFIMLCQILQTEDVASVQRWLDYASNKEKELVLQIIQSAINYKDEYYNFQTNPSIGITPITPNEVFAAPNEAYDISVPEISSQKVVDKLIVQEDEPMKRLATSQSSKTKSSLYLNVPIESKLKDENNCTEQLSSENPKPPQTPVLRFTKTSASFRSTNSVLIN